MDHNFITLVLTIREKHGEATLLSPRKLRTLLADYAAGAYKGECRNFLLALEYGLVTRLRMESNPSEAFLRTQASFFADSFGLTEKTGESIVWCWAEALGLSIAVQEVLMAHMSSSAAHSTGAAKENSPTFHSAPRASQVDAGLPLYTNSIGMEFVLLPCGSFMMGSDIKRDKRAFSNEMPERRVRISKPFYLGKYEVTQAQWEAIMGSNPSFFKRRNNPVEGVSWDDAQAFIRKLNQKEGSNCYRLPTEAEWEYAARAGTKSSYAFGDDAAQLGLYAWYRDNSGGTIHPVGQKEPNPWGLYDMHGNAYEWVQDWYGKKYYGNSASSDPKGPSSGSFRVLRGGGWGSSAWDCRSAYRFYGLPDYRINYLGLRLVLSPE